MSITTRNTLQVSNSFKQQIEQSIIAFDLLPGLQAICKGHFRGFPQYQLAIIRTCFKRSAYPSIILGGREIGKTFPLSFGFLLRAVTEPDFELFCVPGEKIDQAKVALRYMDILSRKSKVLKGKSGINKKLRLEWSTLTKQFWNGSIIKALAPNEGVLSEHGSVWCDEYQSLPDAVDKALDGFDNRTGDRRWLSGTAQIRGSPLHRVYLVESKRHPQNIIEVPVEAALRAKIVDRTHIESKKMENGGKLNPTEFDAWFKCKFPDLGTLGWHPKESTLDERYLIQHGDWSQIGTGCDPGIPLSHYVKCVALANGDIHAIKEFDLDDIHVTDIVGHAPGNLYAEMGIAFHGGYNFAYHNILQIFDIRHQDSFVDGDEGHRLFGDAAGLQALGKLYVNPHTCPNLMRGCEEQTFDINGKMDDLPLSDYIFAWLHGIRAVSRSHGNSLTPVSRSNRGY